MKKDTMKIEVFKETFGHIQREAAEKKMVDLEKEAGILANTIINNEYYEDSTKCLQYVEERIQQFWKQLKGK